MVISNEWIEGALERTGWFTPLPCRALWWLPTGFSSGSNALLSAVIPPLPASPSASRRAAWLFLQSWVQPRAFARAGPSPWYAFPPAIPMTLCSPFRSQLKHPLLLEASSACHKLSLVTFYHSMYSFYLLYSNCRFISLLIFIQDLFFEGLPCGGYWARQ